MACIITMALIWQLLWLSRCCTFDAMLQRNPTTRRLINWSCRIPLGDRLVRAIDQSPQKESTADTTHYDRLSKTCCHYVIYIWNCWYITTNYWRFTPLKGQLNKKCCYSNVIMSVETVVRPVASWVEWQCQSICHAAVSEQMQVDHPGVRMLTSLPLSQTYHIHASPEHHVSIYQLSNIYLLHYYYTHLMASFPGQHG